MGGRSLPNLIFYNWACHARHLWSWLHSFVKGEVCVDYWASYPHSPWSLVTCDANNINPEIKHNPVIYSSIRVWHDISKYLGREKRKSLLSPIIQNPDFPAGVSSSVFFAWRDKGVYVLDHLFKDNGPHSSNIFLRFFRIVSYGFWTNNVRKTSAKFMNA